MIPASVVGQSEAHLCEPSDASWLTVSVHRGVVDAFRALQDAAASSGFDHAILTPIRGIDQHLSNSNRKPAAEHAHHQNNPPPHEKPSQTQREHDKAN